MGDKREILACFSVEQEDISLLERKALHAPEMWDLFEGMVEVLTRSPHLWPNVKAYCRRELPGKLFQELQAEYAGTSSPCQSGEWKSPHPSRCLDCSLQKGGNRGERVMWGLLQRHDCPDLQEVSLC